MSSQQKQDKLLYFPARAWAEPIQMLYALAGQQLQDDTVTQAEWFGSQEIKNGKACRDTLVSTIWMGVRKISLKTLISYCCRCTPTKNPSWTTQDHCAMCPVSDQLQNLTHIWGYTKNRRLWRFLVTVLCAIRLFHCTLGNSSGKDPIDLAVVLGHHTSALRQPRV